MKNLILKSALSLAFVAGSAFAGDTAGSAAPGMAAPAAGASAAAKGMAPSKEMAPGKEMREKMAVVHEKMATCLRSEKPVSECHDEMKQGHEAMGEKECPMMRKHDHMVKHRDMAPAESK